VAIAASLAAAAAATGSRTRSARAGLGSLLGNQVVELARFELLGQGAQ
jgi:hypothetical protein